MITSDDIRNRVLETQVEWEEAKGILIEEIRTLWSTVARRDAEIAVLKYEADQHRGKQVPPVGVSTDDWQSILRHAIELTMMIGAGFVDTGDAAALVTLARENRHRERASKIILNLMLRELAYKKPSTPDHMIDAIEQLMSLASED